MKTFLLTTAAALIAVANPANAQILGGGGILSGPPPMPVLPSMPVPMSIPVGPISSVTNGSVTGAATAAATKSVDTRSGKASATGSANGSATGSLTQSLDTPLNSLAASGTGSGSAAGSARADAQLFGSDAIRGTLRQTRDSAGNLVTTFRDRAGNFVTATRDRAGNLVVATRDRAGNLLSTTSSAAGSAQGSASGSANGTFNGLSHNLALDGSAAADAAGSLDVKPGTSLFDMSGEKIGKVREVFADARGQVKGLLVKSGDTTALLPASDFAAKGDALVTVLSEAQLIAAGEGQSSGSTSGSANGIFSGLSHSLALSGSAAADLNGTFDVKPGTQLYDMAGEKIGKVKSVMADASGRVEALVVKVKDTTATLPAADFAANGDVLVTLMSEAQVAAAGQKQADGSPAPASAGKASTETSSRSRATSKGNVNSN